MSEQETDLQAGKVVVILQQQICHMGKNMVGRRQRRQRHERRKIWEGRSERKGEIMSLT